MCNVFVWVFLLGLVLAADDTSQNNKKQTLERGHIRGPSKIPNTVHHTYVARNGSSDPEVNKKAARLARYIVHNSNWVAIATISRLEDWTGRPFAGIKSIADGPVDQSTGWPYFYLTPLDDTVKDLMGNNKASIIMSMEQDGYCSRNGLDPEDLKCGKAGMLGQVVEVPADTEEYEFAKNALFERHPNMRNWPRHLGYFVAKFQYRDVGVFDGDGYEKKCVPLDVYQEAEPQERPEH